MDSPAPKSGKPAVDDDADDPFERLPDHILHHILSLLPRGKEAARAALISRLWRRAWSSYPLFDFALEDFEPETSKHLHWRMHSQPPPDGQRETVGRFLVFVDRRISLLRQQGTPLPRLKLHTGLMEADRSSALCDKWIGMALDDGAQELDLYIPTEDPDLLRLGWTYSVPARVFRSGFLKSLHIAGTSLVAHLGSIAAVSLNSLHTLKVCYTPIDDEMLRKLLRGCPQLEHLELRSCEPLGQVVISGLNKLKTVDLGGGVDRLEIEAPRLEDFMFSGKLKSGDAIVGLDRCRRLKRLELWSNSISQEHFQDILPKFRSLESLTISYCESIKKIRIRNLLLKDIKVHTKLSVDIDIDAPKLSSFMYNSTCFVLPFIRMREPGSLSNCRAMLMSHFHPVPDAEWFVGLGEFLNRSCWLRSIRLRILSTEEPDVPPVDNLLSSSPCGIDELDLGVGTPPSLHTPILDGLLSVCHPKILNVGGYFIDNGFLESLCRKLATREDNTRCRCSSRRKCWLHELKSVEIERITPTDHEGSLDWRTLFDLLPTLGSDVSICFRLYW